MYFSAKSLDDATYRILRRLLDTRKAVVSTRGASIELTGVLFKIVRPRARLSRSEGRGLIFSPLGEFLWYLSKNDSLKQISYYIPQYRKESDDGKTVPGAYGPRLFSKDGIDQVAGIIRTLQTKPSSRRAVIQLFDATDQKHRQVPCTCTLQFILRNGKLNLIVTMRSNDAYLGLPHDVFAFTMLQEIIARTVTAKLGYYKHFVGSLHLYNEHIAQAQSYLEEAWQEVIEMPPMPPGDPWHSINTVLAIESKVRGGRNVDLESSGLANYWKDIVRLLLIFRASKRGRQEEISALKDEMTSDVYNFYIEKKRRVIKKRPEPQQKGLFLETEEDT